MISKPNKVHINLTALAQNLDQIRSLLATNTQIMGVVKADAYGHGLLPISRTLEQNRIDCLGVAYLKEALFLRKNGSKLPIMVLCGINTMEESQKVVENNLTPVIYDPVVAERLSRESISQGKKTRVHIKVDTGMGRLGIHYQDIGNFVKKILPLKGLEIEALITHLSSADEQEQTFTTTQIQNFKMAIREVQAMGLELPLNSMANSAGIMKYKDSHFNLVRPGIALYGGLPANDFASPVRLKPVMTFYGQVLQVRDVQDNTPLSYARTHYTKGPRRIAILSAGYSNGLSRLLSNRGKVIIRGIKFPIVGRICMNLTICDITGSNAIKPGDKAVFLGSQDNTAITAEKIAHWADTISYEVFCSIGQNNNKEYV